MARVYGRCSKGKRLRASIPHGHWKTTTFVGALRHDRLTAPCVFNGPIDGDSFLAYVKEFLAPTLAPGDIVVMDNLSSHKVSGVMEAIEHRGARVIFLPPYSPDFSPIEQAFAKLKAWLRKVAKRTISELCDAIGQALDFFSPQECLNYFFNSGYGLPMRETL
jgi:transposase